MISLNQPTESSRTLLKLHIIIDGKRYEVEYDTEDTGSPSSAPNFDRAQSIVLPTPLAQDAKTAEDVGSNVCRSPVAGIVARINVEPGESVKDGDVLLVVEAMKMENNLAASSAATVKSVKVKVGDTVKLGQILVEFQ